MVQDAERLREPRLTLDRFPLPGNLPLRQATQADLTNAIQCWQNQIDRLAHKIRWLNAIHDTLSSSETVAEVLDSTRLHQLKAETA